MSNTKTVMSQAANTLTTPLNVEDVFSTYLYEGNGSTQTITNGIDLAGEGGLVWAKIRDTSSTNHMLVDTERGTGNVQRTNFAAADQTGTFLNSFNSNGFTLANNFDMNGSGYDIASWTFRKAPKFFDVVTYTGDGTDTREVSHNLGSKPGMIAIKSTSTSNNWVVWHRGATGSTGTINGDLTEGAKVRNAILLLNSTNALTSLDNSIKAPSSTTLYFGDRNNSTEDVNVSGREYVAYLFAHNDGDGGFNGGDIIKCGSGTTDGSGNVRIELGFEPQWIMWKNTAQYGWSIADVMRGGLALTGDINDLEANTSGAERGFDQFYVPDATGFTVTNGVGANVNFIYIAIRRGTKVPESGTEVFDVNTATQSINSSSPPPATGFVTDLGFYKSRSSGSSSWVWADRLRGAPYLLSNSTAAEASGAGFTFDRMDGWSLTAGAWEATSSYGFWGWKRAPNFFDVVAYTGDGVAGRTVSHNLGVAPEMMWIKRRDSAVNWPVYAAPLGATKRAFLNLTNAFATDSTYWNNTEPTSTEFTLGTYIGVNASGGEYIAYLFSSLAGISKVGSYTGNGGSQTIDCGFTSGARFVLIRASNSVSNWYVFDTERGIVVGNDPYLSLNTTNAEQAGYDHLTPDSSGFTVTSSDFNANGQPYLFYAIA